MNDVGNTSAIIQKFEPLLKGLTQYELTVLNKMVVDRIKLMHRAGALMSMASLHVGDLVSWKGKDGIARKGIIIRLNSKTASINTGDEGYWKVSPQMLHKEN
jgi:hypothetical protein